MSFTISGKNTDLPTKEYSAEINDDILVNPEIVENLTKLQTNEEIKNITIINTDINATKADKVVEYKDGNIGSDVTIMQIALFIQQRIVARIQMEK